MHNSISFWKAGDLLGGVSSEAVVYGSGVLHPYVCYIIQNL